MPDLDNCARHVAAISQRLSELDGLTTDFRLLVAWLLQNTDAELWAALAGGGRADFVCIGDVQDAARQDITLAQSVLFRDEWVVPDADCDDPREDPLKPGRMLTRFTLSEKSIAELRNVAPTQ